MTCEECVNVICRVKVDHTIDTVCCLDGKAVMYIIECNRFIEKVPADGRPIVEKPEVVDLGYGAVPVIKDIPTKKKGWPLGRKRK